MLRPYNCRLPTSLFSVTSMLRPCLLYGPRILCGLYVEFSLFLQLLTFDRRSRPPPDRQPLFLIFPPKTKKPTPNLPPPPGAGAPSRRTTTPPPPPPQNPLPPLPPITQE